MFYKGNEDREKRLRFSIRKVSFGAASVAVAALFMFPGNGTVSATEQGVTPTNEGTQSSPLKDPDVQNGTYGATPVVSQLDGNSGSSETTAPKAQADTTTPTPADSSSTSVESAPASKVQDETPAPTPADESVASVTPASASATEEVEEKATSNLDKKQLEEYVAEIDAKLASGSYENKTDESVATLKEHLELAKLALTTAKSQEELTKAYRRLFTTANSGLRSKPKAQVESPKLDTTEGKATVGKKASNTEKATGTNSIANSGQHDTRNGQALDRNNPFRTDGTTTDTDPAAHQVFEGTSDDDSVEELARKLRALDDTVENNKKVSEELDSLGAATGVAKGTVQNINEFGGWTAITDSEGNGKFAIARKTDKGVFPLETINTVRNVNNNVTATYLREQALDRTADYMLFLSEVRTKASENEPTFNGQAYRESGLGRGLAYGLKGYNGIQKTFKAYSPDSGSKVKITFKTGYSGDIDGTKAKYRVQVFTSASSTNPVYDVTFDPQNNTTNADMTVLKASDGSSVTRESIQGRAPLNKQNIEDQMAQAGYTPNGVAGKFTSREIELPAGVTDYTVKISSADNDRLGMGYQALHRHYALPISGLDFHVTQDTGEVAKELLKKVYLKLKETEEKDKTFKTAESQQNYEAELQKIDQLLKEPTKSATDYKNFLTDVLIKKQELANSSQEASIKSNATDEIDKAVATKIQAIEGNAKLSEADKAKAKDAVTAAANAAKVAIVAAQNPAEVTEKEAAGKQAISAVPEVGKEQA
ncbi:YSIRK-type signal peptide-containing protein, partial [Streptococcus pseudopneumoniae]|uniref:YSIRK-type signal peptide-containing protein n=1 Tax=Streptococcus pseudopneumoniae TaxID=257758 RepID=UPI00066EB2B6